MSDRLGRLHKIIITQQWSELPHWHFHTTSDLCGNLGGHYQGQGSARAPVIGQLVGPSCCSFLLSSIYSFPECSSSSFCLSIAHTLLQWPGPIETSHLLGAQKGKQEKINREDEWRPGALCVLGGFTHTKKNQHIYRYKSVLLVTNKSRIGLEIVTKMEKNVSAVRTMQPFKESGHCSYNYGGTIVLDVLLSCTDFRMAKEATRLLSQRIAS